MQPGVVISYSDLKENGFSRIVMFIDSSRLCPGTSANPSLTLERSKRRDNRFSKSQRGARCPPHLRYTGMLSRASFEEGNVASQSRGTDYWWQPRHHARH